MWDQEIDRLQTKMQYVEWNEGYEIKSFVFELLELLREMSSAIQKPR